MRIYAINLIALFALFFGVDCNVINLLTSNAGVEMPLGRAKTIFEGNTGHTVNITLVSPENLFDSIMSDLSNAESKYDGYVTLTSALPLYVECYRCNVSGPGLLDVTDLTNSTVLKWDGIITSIRQYSTTFNQHVYGTPISAPYQYLFYRSDVLFQNNINVPASWDELITAASKLHGKDLNGDTVADFGICHPNYLTTPNTSVAYNFFNILASLVQLEGTTQGWMFDTDTMETFINSDAGNEALKIYDNLLSYTYPASNSPYYTPFLQGRCAFVFSWGNFYNDINATQFRSVVRVAVPPGSDSVLNRDTGKIQKCDEILCPFASNGVNKAPYAGESYFGSVSARTSPERQKLVFNFFSLVSSPEFSTSNFLIGDGMSPLRNTHFDANLWVGGGYDALSLINSLPPMLTSITHPNVAINSRVISYNNYIEAIDKWIHLFTRRNISISDAQKNLVIVFNNITDNVGRELQREIYRKALGLPPYQNNTKPESESNLGLVIGAIGGGTAFVIITLAVVVIIIVKRSSKFKSWIIKEVDVTIGESIGSGGFGVVFKGTWQGNTVAIKKVVLNSKITNTELINDSKNSAFISKKATSARKSQMKSTVAKKQMWEEELSIISKLRHTNVLFLFGAYSSSGFGYLVMEYMTQGSLFDILQNVSLKSSLGWKKRLGFAIDACKGMQYLHNQNPPIFHRDLKSPNLMVDDHWIVKVGDFGFAGSSGDQTKKLVANPWTAPELMEGDRNFTAEMDIFALAIIMWEILEVKDPFFDLSSDDLIFKVQNEGYRPPITVTGKDEYVSLMKQTWDVDPDKRPNTLVLVEKLNEINEKTPVDSELPKTGVATELIEAVYSHEEMQTWNSGGAVPSKSFEDITVLFSDICGFTNLSSSRSAETVTNMLKRLFGKYRESAKKHGVFPLETIGDAYIVACGFKGEPDHSARMAKFALDMIEIANSTEIEEGKPDTVNIRVGVHCGPVVGTLVGKFTLLGDTMNIGTKMESSSQPNHAQASHSIFKKIKDDPYFTFTDRGSIQIKGKGELKTYFLAKANVSLNVDSSQIESISLPGTV